MDVRLRERGAFHYARGEFYPDFEALHTQRTYINFFAQLCKLLCSRRKRGEPTYFGQGRKEGKQAIRPNDERTGERA